MQRNLIALTLVAATAIPAIGIAGNDSPATGPVAEAIRAMLTEQGYDVRGIETEDGLFEVYAIKDGQREELYLTADLEIVPDPDGADEDGEDTDEDEEDDDA